MKIINLSNLSSNVFLEHVRKYKNDKVCILCAISDEYIPTQSYDKSNGFDCYVRLENEIEYYNELNEKKMCKCALHIDVNENERIEKQTIFLSPYCRYKLPLGFKVAFLNNQSYMLVLPRSGLAYRNGITIINTPGLVDWNYRGEVCCLAINMSNTMQGIQEKTKICQVLFMNIDELVIYSNKEIFNNFEKYFPTERSAKGFGSSG